jgi:ABC-type Fe3+ transport system permease subunit
MALPGPLVAIGVIWLLNRPQPALFPWLYDETLFAPTLAISLRTIPIATLIVWTALRSIEQDQVEIARVDGLGPLSLLWQVLLPQRLAAVAIAWLAAFAIAAGDLTSSLLVIPPGQTTIANQIFLLIHAGVHNAEAGLCLGQLAFFATIAVTVLALCRQRR